MAVKVGYLIDNEIPTLPATNSTGWGQVGTPWPAQALQGAEELDQLKGFHSGSRTQNAPLSLQAKTRVGYRLGSFKDIFYDRILIEPSALKLGNLVSSQTRAIKIFNAYFSPRTLSSINLTNSDGITVSGLTFPVTIGALQEVQLNVIVSSSGPATIDATLSFDFLGTSDDFSLKITGARLVGLPFQAKAPMTEQLAWKTNILTTINNKEQRVRVRNKPRQTFSTSYPISKQHHNLANNLVHGWQFRRWAIPLWTEVQQVGPINSGATNINCTTNVFDIRAGALIMLWESVDKNEIIEVQSVTGSGVVLTRGVSLTFTNPILLPVRLCRNLGGIGRDTSGFESFLLAKFEALDNIRLPEVVPPQYQGHDLYLTESLLLASDSNRHAIKARVDTIDYGPSIPHFTTPWQYARATMPFVAIKEGPAENWAFRQFLHRRAGRLRPFWIPTFENDFEKLPTQSGLVTTAIQVKENQYSQFTASHRKDIAIELDTGVWEARRINGTSPIDSTSFTIALDTTLNVQAHQIKRISFLDLMRFDTDTININWQGNGVSSCEINMKQIEA